MATHQTVSPPIPAGVALQSDQPTAGPALTNAPATPHSISHDFTNESPARDPQTPSLWTYQTPESINTEPGSSPRSKTHPLIAPNTGSSRSQDLRATPTTLLKTRNITKPIGTASERAEADSPPLTPMSITSQTQAQPEMESPGAVRAPSPPSDRKLGKAKMKQGRHDSTWQPPASWADDLLEGTPPQIKPKIGMASVERDYSISNWRPPVNDSAGPSKATASPSERKLGKSKMKQGRYDTTWQPTQTDSDGLPEGFWDETLSPGGPRARSESSRS